MLCTRENLIVPVKVVSTVGKNVHSHYTYPTLTQRSSNVSSASDPAALGTSSSLPRNVSTRGEGAVVQTIGIQ